MQKITELAVALGAVLLVVGCKEETIRVYDVPKDRVVASVKAPAPEGWQEAPPGEMRVASYVIQATNGAKADVSVIPLSNSGGKELDNVNRWRSSVGQQGFTNEADLAKTAQVIQIGGAPAKLYEAAGASPENDAPTRVLGAIQIRDGTGWFFKMSGDDKLVTAQKPTFIKYLEGYTFPDPHAGHNHGPGEHPEPPAGVAGAAGDPHAGLDMKAAPPTPEAGPPERSWPAPPSWQQQKPGMMQDAKFLVGGGKAEVTVSTAGGTMAMNIKRWRVQQLGLPDLDEVETLKLATPLDLGGVQAKLVDLAGAKERMIVVIVPSGDFNIFYKLKGQPTAVAAEKDALIEFARKAK